MAFVQFTLVNFEIRRTVLWSECKEKIEHFLNHIKCRFIGANRIKIQRSRITSNAVYGERNSSIHNYNTDESIEKCSERLYSNIVLHRDRYLRIAEQLNMTFPKRAIEAMLNKDVKYNLEELNMEMEDINEWRAMYEAYGLIPKEVNETIIQMPENEELSAEMLAMLGVYVEDYSKKMMTGEKLLEDILLFERIINQEHKFTDKQMRIDPNIERRNFIYFVGTNHNIIHLRKLSSGEKNDFILFFDLIFGTDNHTLILMDEPEISTHISWQMSFSKEVDDICKKTGMQVLVATHSPNIVRGFQDHTISMLR